MNNSVVLLSVCIPTYNRLHYLRQSLDTLLSQAEEQGVDVFVSDNHSTDGTSAYLHVMQQQFKRLRYSIQEENIGLDRNMLEAIGNGKGQYILPLGDDEVLPPGALSVIVKALDDAPDVLVLNGWHTDAKLAPTRIHLAPSVAGTEFQSAAAAFEMLWDKMPFGSFLASRECFMSQHSARYVGTSHAYTGAVWEALAAREASGESCKIKCMSEPTVLLRGGEKTWRNDAALIMLYEIPKWFSLLEEHAAYKRVISPIRLKYLKQTTGLSTLVGYRAAGQLNSELVALLQTYHSPGNMKRIRAVAGIPVIIAIWINGLRDTLVHVRRLLR